MQNQIAKIAILCRENFAEAKKFNFQKNLLCFIFYNL